MTDSAPLKRRHKGLWWKVPLLGLMFLLVLLVIVHALWSKSERNRLEAAVTAIKARGEPIEPGDWLEPVVADGKNLAVLIREASAARVKDAGRTERRREIYSDDATAFELPLTQIERELLQADLTDNSKALTLLAQLDQRPAIAWNVGPTAAPAGTLDQDFSSVRDLANLLADAARVDIEAGRPLQALAYLERLEPLARSMDAKRSILAYMVGSGIRAMHADVLIECAPSIDARDPVVRTAVQRQVAMLLDDAQVLASGREGLVGERSIVYAALRTMAGNPAPVKGAVPAAAPTVIAVPNPFVVYLGRPVFDRSNRLMLSYFEEAVRLADAADYAVYQQRVGPLQQRYGEILQSKLGFVASILLPPLNRAHEIGFRVMTDRHLAATVLAIRLYEADHNVRPATLDALVPAYLARVPIDPMAGQSIRYDVRRGILWSVGENRTDEGGDPTSRTAGGRERWPMNDAVVFLARQPRPATQPAASTMPAS